MAEVYLPDTVLEQLLQLVPQQDLGTCSLVQRRWRDTAVASITHMRWRSVHVIYQLSLSPRWHIMARHITSLDLCGGSMFDWTDARSPAQRLCTLDWTNDRLCTMLQQCGQLAKLSVSSFNIPSYCTQPTLLLASTGLTELHLLRSTMAEDSDSLTALSSLSRLQHLVISYLWSKTTYHNPSQLSADVISALPSGLSKLEVDGVKVAAAGLLHLPHLTGLRALSLRSDNTQLTEDWTPGHLAALGQLKYLTSLRLDMGRIEDLEAGPGTPPFIGLTALRDLELRYCWLFCPAVLAGITGLHRLHLVRVKFTEPDGFAALLAVLAQLQQLHDLELCQLEQDPVTPAEAYSAMTACSQLRRLRLSHAATRAFDDHSVPGRLPQGVWQHMFPPGRQLLGLSHLQLMEFPASSSFVAADLVSMVHCCPALQSLNLFGVMQPGMPLAALAQLDGLSHLSVDGLNDETVQHLAPLTTLTSLSVRLKCEVSEAAASPPAGVMHLTRLTNLRSLHLQMPGLLNYAYTVHPWQEGDEHTNDIFRRLQRDLCRVANLRQAPARQAPAP